ncbi:arginine--tRNA ligase [Candidatus Kaiserbacteria bacterium]|nr:arginine--tRNA ligase [Candidatus Kaiserbacteria bacterium]
MEEKIRKAVAVVLAEMGARNIGFVVERPADMVHGDYAMNVALKAFGPIQHGNFRNISGRSGSSKMYQYRPTLGGFKNPIELAKEIAQRIQGILGKSVSKVEVAGPGFVNITLAREAVALAIAEADAKGKEWGRGNINAGQRVMIEYTDPNPFKEMHIGHLMSNAIGEAMARLMEYSGAEVKRANYQGDVGPHIAKAVWAVKNHKVAGGSWGDAYVMGNKAYETDEAAKKEIDEMNATIYSRSDELVSAIYDEGRKASLAHFEEIYKTLGTKFDYYFYESETAPFGKNVVEEHPEIFEKSEGAIVYKGDKDKGLHTRVFINSKGLPTYEAKELGLAKKKYDIYPYDKSIVITGNEINEYFRVLLDAMLKVYPELVAKTVHISHGMMRLAFGKMSSREGNVITADEFIQSVIKRVGEKNPDPLIAEKVAIGAIKYMILRQAPGSDIVFDEEKSLSLEGDSGPYLQYALVRAKSVLAQASGAPVAGAPESPYLIERIILHFPEVVARASRELAPNLLVNYLTELAGEWNSFYAKERIVGGDHETHKLLITRAFANTMTNGLTVLGIPAPEKM